MHLAVAGDVFDGVFLCCPVSPRDVLDEIWDLIEAVSEGFPTYFRISNPSDYSIEFSRNTKFFSYFNSFHPNFCETD